MLLFLLLFSFFLTFVYLFYFFMEGGLNGCWKNPFVDFCIGLVCQLMTCLRMGSQYITKTMQKQWKGTVTINIRYTKFKMFIDLSFFNEWGRVCTSSGVILANPPYFFKLPLFSGHNMKQGNHLPNIQCLLFKTPILLNNF